MTKRKFGVGILVLAMVLGVAFTACDTGSGVGGNGGGGGGGGTGGGGTAGGTDPALNGVWFHTSWDGAVLPKFVFNNGNFEQFDTFGGYAGNLGRGTFTTSGNTLTKRFTHLHGSISGNLEWRWYTVAEFEAIFLPCDWCTGEFCAPYCDLTFMFYPTTLTYFINGDRLTLIGNVLGYGGPIILNR